MSNELLFRRGINFNDLLPWQRRGVGLYWEDYEKDGLDPRTGEKTVARRQRLKVDMELPMKEGYREFLLELMAARSES